MPEKSVIDGRDLEIDEWPFANLPEAKGGRGGQGAHEGKDG
jgi:hypothetical protein